MSATTTVVLKDQTRVLIRPMTSDDLEQSLAFFRALPEEVRACFRKDLTTLEAAQERIREMEEGRVKRLIAFVDDKMAAVGALELSQFGWERHVGELRLIVAPAYQAKGLGVLMGRALYDLAASTGVEQVVIRVMSSQRAAINVLRKLGFRKDAVLRDYVRDSYGRKHDLVLLRGDIADLWQEFEHYVYELDVPTREMD
jgi:RimJ/RimL family protein N-acetyltransferase